MKKRLLVIMLALAMLVTFMPSSAYAEGQNPVGYQDEDGYWYYLDNDGNVIKGWIYTRDEEGELAWYYSDPNTGRCVTGWRKLGGYWYFFGESTGRMCDHGVTYVFDRSDFANIKMYYFAPRNGSGKWGTLQYGWIKEPSMTEGATRELYIWYYADPDNDGQLTIGWKKINGKWYYFKDTNTGLRAMMNYGGPHDINGHYYMFGGWNDGSLKTGWVEEKNRQNEDVWYYADPNNDSRLAIGWKKISDTWYHFNESCEMTCNAFAKDSIGWLYLGSDGKPVSGKWIRDDGEWYYIKKNGYMAAKEWAKDSTGWMWMDAGGMITKDKWIKYNGEWYYLKPDGYMAANEWADDSTGRCWLNADGAIAVSRIVLYDGDIYYVDENGYMVCDRTVVIDGAEYYFSPDGKMIPG